MDQFQAAQAEDDSSLHGIIRRGDAAQLCRELQGGHPALETPDGEGERPLAAAMRAGRLDLAALLLQAGATTETRDDDGNTDLFACVIAKNLPMAQLLLSHGADALARRNGNQSLLHIAAKNGDHDMMALLIEHGAAAVIDEQTAQYGQAALHMAVAGNDAKGAGILLAAGASPHLENAQGLPPLHVAAHLGNADIIRLLRGAGADIDRTAGPEKRTALQEALSEKKDAAAVALIRLGADPEMIDDCGRDALRQAVFVGGMPLLRALFNANLLRPGQDMLAGAVHDAIFYEQDHTARWLIEQAGADIRRAVPLTGETALHAAAQRENHDMMAYLLARGADPAARDSRGRSPLDLARQGKNGDVAALLENPPARQALKR